MITVAPSVSTSIMSAFLCSTATTAKIASIGRCQRLLNESLRRLPVNHNGALRSFSAIAYPEEKITGEEVKWLYVVGAEILMQSESLTPYCTVGATIMTRKTQLTVDGLKR